MEKARAVTAGIVLILIGIVVLYMGQEIPNQSLTTIIGIVVMIGGGIIIALTIKG